jgi:hypothetical protein
LQQERALNPRRYQAVLEGRLREAEAKAARIQEMVDWQQSLIACMCADSRELGLAREILATLCESLQWNQTLATQTRRDLDFVSRNIN